jgi:hypothetical protein
VLVDLEDPEAQHAVGDLQRVIELVEQVDAALEAVEAVVRLGVLADLVRELARAPSLGMLERPGRLDPLLRLSRERVATLVRGGRIEHQHQFIVACHSGGLL